MRRSVASLAALVSLAAGLSACSSPPDPIRVGAVYPLGGSQGPGGVQEFRGVTLATDMVNDLGGVGGRHLVLDPVDAESADAAPGAVDQLASNGDRFVLGSYGSVISAPAAAEAARRDLLYWETGAVGLMSPAGQGRTTFRVAPSGPVLGSAAIAFIADRLSPMLHRDPRSLRFAVVNVDDVYGRAVAEGGVREIHDLDLPFAGQFEYSLRKPDYAGVVRRLAEARPDVVFVSAYLADGVAIRREMVRQHLTLVANIGSSSSYCMQAFGDELGADAVGVFASDKPDAGALDPAGLTPAARSLLGKARTAYRSRWHEEMTAPALAGFSAAWALFRTVMPKASALTPVAVGDAAHRVAIPPGGLPNGSGLRFGAPGTPDAGANLRAASVIWEWLTVGWRAVVWPPKFATDPVEALPIA